MLAGRHALDRARRRRSEARGVVAATWAPSRETCAVCAGPGDPAVPQLPRPRGEGSGARVADDARGRRARLVGGEDLAALMDAPRAGRRPRLARDGSRRPRPGVLAAVTRGRFDARRLPDAVWRRSERSAGIRPASPVRWSS